MERTKGPQKPSQIRRDASGRFATPDALVVERFPASQQGAWTEAGKERRKAELERRRQQHVLSMDSQAAIVAALDHVPPEPVSASPAATSQAGDTLAVTEYREPEQEPSRLVFGLWCAIAGAAAVCVAVVCLQAAGVL